MESINWREQWAAAKEADPQNTEKSLSSFKREEKRREEQRRKATRAIEVGDSVAALEIRQKIEGPKISAQNKSGAAKRRLERLAETTKEAEAKNEERGFFKKKLGLGKVTGEGLLKAREEQERLKKNLEKAREGNIMFEREYVNKDGDSLFPRFRRTYGGRGLQVREANTWVIHGEFDGEFVYLNAGAKTFKIGDKLISEEDGVKLFRKLKPLAEALEQEAIEASRAKSEHLSKKERDAEAAKITAEEGQKASPESSDSAKKVMSKFK